MARWELVKAWANRMEPGFTELVERGRAMDFVAAARREGWVGGASSSEQLEACAQRLAQSAAVDSAFGAMLVEQWTGWVTEIGEAAARSKGRSLEGASSAARTLTKEMLSIETKIGRKGKRAPRL